MEYRLPYYMAYPMPLQYDGARIERRDFEYMKSMYPIAVKRILPYIEEECDRMSYEGSVIYDEYPDRWQLYRLAESIVTILKNEERGMNPQQSDEMEDSKWMWIQELVTVLLYYEILTRRQRKENRRYF